MSSGSKWCTPSLPPMRADQSKWGRKFPEQPSYPLILLLGQFALTPKLISKLEYYGIQGPTLNWLKAFLTNREQTVVVEGKASAPVKVASGVPQGTVLGPLLFLLYINDLPDQLDSNVRLFADDCLLYVELSTQTDSQLHQKDLNTLEEWQSKWLMQFNPEKCYIMHITNKRTPHATSYQFCGQALATTKIHPYLGVTLTSGLKWGRNFPLTDGPPLTALESEVHQLISRTINPAALPGNLSCNP
ncbi:hypothetical protein Bbelb_432280 [Branchiostoma belcheri]|nr:hypothetical protein Bbelb_432280 [Branchiostoma belcheri]